MSPYVDLFLTPVPVKNLARYRRLARAWGRIVRSHGALEYREMVLTARRPASLGAIASAVTPRRGETVLATMVGYRSRRHHDLVDAAASKDLRMRALRPPSRKRAPPAPGECIWDLWSKERPPLFDAKRTILGQFRPLLTETLGRRAGTRSPKRRTRQRGGTR